MIVVDVIERLSLHYPCPTCGEPALAWCRTRGLRAMTRGLHSARMWPVQSAFGEGYQEGRRDADALAGRRS